MDSEEVTQKRPKREKPNKKWTENDVNKILAFLHESPEFEKPTAQFFYTKLIEKTGVDASWNMIRWKVRNLRKSFNDANDWRRSTGAGLLETDLEGINSVQKKILRKCPYYEELKEIFGKKPVAEKAENVVGTLEESFSELEKIDEDVSIFLDDIDCSPQLSNIISPGQQQTPTPSTSAGIVSKQARDFAQKMKRYTPKTSISQLTEIQLERSAIQKLRYELEKGKFATENELQERRLKLEKERHKSEQEWRKQEFELKRLEMKKKTSALLSSKLK